MLKICAILLSYKRPQNMNALLADLCELDEVVHIILSNNNPDIDIRTWIDKEYLNDSKIEIINQSQREHCVKRFELANNSPFDFFICPDDDLFLSKRQYQQVFHQFALSPDKVHGVRGQIAMFHRGQSVLKSGLSGIDTELDILNCFYAFTRQHITKYFQLMQSNGITDINALEFVDDIYLSFCGEGLPRCINVGELKFCESQDEVGIATWRETGFDAKRLAVYANLKQQKLMHSVAIA
ncbi:MAG: hypothetical protein AAGB12_10280 [Pseudomonadota bacterium]